MSRKIRVTYTGNHAPEYEMIRRAMAQSQIENSSAAAERTLARIAIITRQARKHAPAPVFNFEKQRMAVQRK